MMLTCRRMLAVVVGTLILGSSAATSLLAQSSLQTGDGLLMIQATMPQTARVGEQFSYRVEVRNTSDDVMLHQIELKQRKTEGFTIESVTIDGKNIGQQAGNRSSDSNGGDKSSSGSKNSSSGNGQVQEAGDGSATMTISSLEPGQSKTLMVKAAADKEGQLKSCLEIANYTPSLCMMTEVVKPDLQITKTAPEKANRCEMIELRYSVRNDGSGQVDRFAVTDSLGEGLVTIDGGNELSFDVDGLNAGEEREFVARVYAREIGTFSSRAVAKADNSDLKSRSTATETQVVSADLMAKVDGPSQIYGDRLATFTATVTNSGNVQADSVKVDVFWPESTNLVDLGEYRVTSNNSQMSGNDQNSDSQNGSQQNRSVQRPTPATGSGNERDDNGSRQSGSRQQSDRQQIAMTNRSFEIDSLAPGETAEFTYAVQTGRMKQLPTKVVATYICSVDAAASEEKSTTEVTTMAMADVKVLRLPALQLQVVDDEDPVQDGTSVTYTIEVWNEGDAPDSNVEIVATLPDALEFKDADGPTEASSDGKRIKFAPIETMEAGDRAQYTVTATPTGSGAVRFEASLKSKMLQQEVLGEEPTQLFASSSE